MSISVQNPSISNNVSFARPSRALLIAVMWVYVIIALVDPFDQIFHLKSSLFLIVMFIWFFRVTLGYTRPGRLSIWMVLVGVGLAIPLISTLIGLISQRTPVVGMRFSTIEIFLLLFLIPVVLTEKIDLSSILIRSCISVAIITLFISAVAYLSPVAYAGVFAFASDKQLAYLSINTDRFGIGTGSFYYKTSAMMVLPLSYYAARMSKHHRHRLMASALVLIYLSALIFSGARANGLAALAIILLVIIQRVQAHIGRQTAIATAIIGLSIGGAIFLPRVLNPTEHSNAIKLGHWHSYMSEFEQHPSYLLWGEGADTEFYSAGFEQNTVITELTYMELIRNFGIPITLFFLVLLIWPVIPLASKRARSKGLSYLVIPYVSYLVMSASNPLLLSTSGMLLVVAVWGAALSVHDDKFLPKAAAFAPIVL